jgi:hypothetical protein
MPLDLVDPASGINYFTAATMLANLDFADTPVSQVPKIAFWENLFPDLAGGGLTATQIAYRDYYSRTRTLPNGTKLNGSGADYTTSLFLLDVDCDPCSRLGKYAFFNSQFSNLNALRSMASANYHSFQLVVRRQFSRGLQATANYTWSKSTDVASQIERNGLFAGPILNSWSPTARKSVSDFDITQQLNMSGIWEIPMGKNRRFFSNASGLTDAIFGGWQFSSLFRITTGLPVSIGNGFQFPTNWEFTGSATQIGSLPSTGVFKNVIAKTGDKGEPNIFSDAQKAFDAFRVTFPGGVGTRNPIRGDGYFTIDTGLAKTWKMPYREGHKLQFRWEVFNMTNTPSFDVFSLRGADLDSRSSFGKYSGTLTNSRVMQFGLRYEF